MLSKVCTDFLSVAQNFILSVKFESTSMSFKELDKTSKIIGATEQRAQFLFPRTAAVGLLFYNWTISETAWFYCKLENNLHSLGENPYFDRVYFYCKYNKFYVMNVYWFIWSCLKEQLDSSVGSE